MAYRCFASPLGDLTLFEDDGHLVAVDWGRPPENHDTPLLHEATEQLAAYFQGRLRAFALPLNPAGTVFQRQVWQLLSLIPYGAFRTYGDLATELGSSARAVGGACGRNPLPIVLPCHRVIAASGALTGYSGGAGIPTKAALLRLEGLVLPYDRG